MKDRFTSVRFWNFKAFKEFSISLKAFNVLVGPNNAGKSTIVSAFRILSEGLRKAFAKKPEYIEKPRKSGFAYSIGLEGLPVATENIFHDYNDAVPATVRFQLANRKALELHFPAMKEAYMFCDTPGKTIRTVSDFRREFDVSLGFVPVLGPVEHNEALFQKEAARLALLTHRAARNFRNIWYHYPDDFDEFRTLICSTWPGMDIERPKVDYTGDPPLLHMFCPEERYLRELYWAGFGFQVWCQMLTFLVKSRDVSLFLIDEPDIYLHSDLQRQLVNLLRGLEPDILIATHSTEIISEADPDELLIINKRSRSAKRVSDPSHLQSVFAALGSNLNPILTQLAKCKRAVFVEGKDFTIISAFARKLGKDVLANRSDISVIPLEGFNIHKIQDFSKGIELSLGLRILRAAVLDNDYRSAPAVEEAKEDLRRFCSFVWIHPCKELENFLLCPSVIDRAVARKIEEKGKRTGTAATLGLPIQEVLLGLTEELKQEVMGQYLAKRVEYEKSKRLSVDYATLNAEVLGELENIWNDLEKRLKIVPGKKVLASFNRFLQQEIQITVSSTFLVSSFLKDEVPPEMSRLIEELDTFSRQPIGN